MIIICAWCGEYLGENGAKNEEVVTHGICPECRSRTLAENDQTVLAPPSDQPISTLSDIFKIPPLMGPTKENRQKKQRNADVSETIEGRNDLDRRRH